MRVEPSVARRDVWHRVGSKLELPRAGWLVLGLVLLINLPTFVHTGVWVDVTHYDVAARTLLWGGVMYRDLFDTNLPGMVWLHAIIRQSFGWSQEAIRLVDLAVVGTIVTLLARWVRDLGASSTAVAWTTVLLAWFYLGQPEWSHVQRDVWMLLPALGALHLRRGQMDAAALGDGPPPAAALFWRACAEGGLWGIAFWIKPFVLVPAGLCWMTSMWVARRAGSRTWGSVVLDLGGIVAGGSAVVAAGIAWLAITGTWPYLLDVLLHWDPEYGAPGYQYDIRKDMIEGWIRETLPWSLLTIFVALPVALFVLWRSRGPMRDDGRTSRRGALVLFTVFVIGWLLQAAFVQPRVQPYAMTPVVLLALTLLAATVPAPSPQSSTGLLAWLAFALAVAAGHPTFDPGRLQLWPRSLRAVVTSAERDRLSLLDSPTINGHVAWADLDRVADFLRDRGVRDGELLCFNDATHPLYLRLGVRPPIRFVQFTIVELSFTSRREAVRDEIASLPIRFVVGDLTRVMPPSADPRNVPGRWTAVYPWNQRQIFRSGRYVVFAHPPPNDNLAARREALRFWMLD